VRRGRLAVTIVSVALVVAFVGACGGGGDDGGFLAGVSTTTKAKADDSGNAGDDGAASGEPLGAIPGGCPIDSAKVSEIVGRDLPEDPASPCRFSDGVAQVEVTVQGTGLFEARKSETEKMFKSVKSLGRGDRGYMATDELRAEAYVEKGKTSLTVTLSSFELDSAGYTRAALGIVDAVLG